MKSKRSNNILYIFLFIILILTCGDSFGNHRSLFFTILTTITNAFLFIFLLFISKLEIKKYNKYVYSGLIITRLLSPFVLPLKISYIIYIIYYFYAFSNFLIDFMKREKDQTFVFFIFLYCTMNTFVQTNVLNVYSILPLIIGIVISLVFSIMIVILFYTYNKKSKRKISMLVSIIFICLLLGATVNRKCIERLNYCLDTSTPIVKEYKILDKIEQISAGRTSSKNYYLILDNYEHPLGEMKVTHYTYNDYEIGDYIKVYKYSGAFNISYYVVDEYHKKY